MSFRELLERVCQNSGKKPFQGKLLALDPGETLGWALFSASELLSCGQQPMVQGEEKEILFQNISFLGISQVDVVVCEDYKVYNWKTEQHSWSSLITPKIIGAIQYECVRHDKPIYFQMAATAKGFCSDDKLKQWGYYERGKRHARDAIRHGCYWLLFGVRA